MQYRRIVENGKTRIEITTEGVDQSVVDALKGKEWLLIFDTGSFTKLNNLDRKNKRGVHIDNVDGEDILASVNYFLDWLSQADRSIILGHMAGINALLHTKFIEEKPEVEDLHLICKKIGVIVEVMNKKIGLFKQCRKFAETKLPLKIDMHAGERPQDSKDMTYYYEDTILLAAAIIYSKLLIGIFGVVSEVCKSYNIKQLNRDTLNNLIVQPLYQGEGKPVIEKIRANTRTIIKQMFGGTNAKAQKRRYVLYGHGITDSLLTACVEAVVPTRLLINISLYSKDINIVGVMHERVQQYVDATLKTAEKNMVIERTDTSNNMDDQQRSRIELDSIISKTPLDTLVLVDYTANSVVSRFISQAENIDRRQFTICKDYLETQPVPYCERNKLIIEAMFGKYIGGASSCSYIKHSTMIKMIAIAQLILAKAGYKQLVYGLSALTSSTPKIEPTTEDYRIVQSFSMQNSYTNFVKLLDTLANRDFMVAEFTKRMNEIVTVLTEEYALYNLPQIIWDILGEENKNGQVITFTEEYSAELCNLLISEWQARHEVDVL